MTRMVQYSNMAPGAGENTLRQGGKRPGTYKRPALRRLALFVYLDHPTKNDVTSGNKAG